MSPKPFDKAQGKRVLIFSIAYDPFVGGAEVAVKEITSQISTNEIEWDLVTLRFNKSHSKFERIGNVNVYRIGGGLGYLSKIFFIPQAAAFAFGRQYDLYWAMMTYMLFPVVLARMLGSKIPYVLTLQDGDPFEHVFKRLRIKIFLPLLKYGFRHATKVQVISNFLATWARQIGYKGEVEVIPNGVDVTNFTNVQSVQSRALDKNSVILITTSRLVEKNAVGDIIQSLKFLPDNINLKILGTGPLESELKLKVKSLKLEARISFLGYVPYEDIPKYLHKADIFIRPSLSEGFGNSFIEAMAAGLPVIATPVGGIVDFLEHEKTGLFCEVNSPESIARQVKRLIGEPELRRKLIEDAKKMVEEKYDWNLVAREMKTRVFDKV